MSDRLHLSKDNLILYNLLCQKIDKTIRRMDKMKYRLDTILNHPDHLGLRALDNIDRKDIVKRG